MGEININEVISEEKYNEIETYFVNAEELTLSPAKEALGDDYSWAELKYVVSYLKFAGKVDAE